MLSPLKDDNVLAATRRIRQALAGLRLHGPKLTFGGAVLGVDDPEKHRAQLLKLVASSSRAWRRPWA